MEDQQRDQSRSSTPFRGGLLATTGPSEENKDDGFEFMPIPGSSVRPVEGTPTPGPQDEAQGRQDHPGHQRERRQLPGDGRVAER